MSFWQLEGLNGCRELAQGEARGGGGGCWRGERGKEVGDHDPQDPLKVGPSSQVEPVFLPGDGSFGLCSGCEVSKRALKEKLSMSL